MKLSVDVVRDPQSVTLEWNSVSTLPIEGVVAREMKPVLTNNGMLVELLRSEWLGAQTKVDQVFSRTLDGGAVSAWHVHRSAVDRLSCIEGRALVVLYDARVDSPTHGTLAEYRLGPARPTLLIIPAGVVHGVKALGPERATLINMVSEAYAYSEPDHWRVDADAAQIPYRFEP